MSGNLDKTYQSYDSSYLANKRIMTFSYNAKVIKFRPLFADLNIKLRKDCNGLIHTIRGFNCLYVTNINEFNEDLNKYGDNLQLRGMQFDVIAHQEGLLRSYTYIPGSMRDGGYSQYALK